MSLALAFTLLLTLQNLRLVSTQPIQELNNEFFPVLATEVFEESNSGNGIISSGEASGSGSFSGEGEG